MQTTPTSAPPARARDSVLSVRGLSKRYGAVRALRDIDLDLSVGEVVGLVGENGAGKSTLLGVLSGSVIPEAGTVSVHGTEVATGHPRRLADAGVAVVVQEQALIENLTVAENLYLTELGRVARLNLLLDRAQLRERAQRHLDDTGVTSVRATDRVGDLSFAQRQMVEIAKAFVAAERAGRQPIILLDEPTSALSKADAQVLFDLIGSWKSRAAIIYVSHILSDVRALSDRIVVLKDGAVVDDLANVGIDDHRLHALMVGRERSADYYQEQRQVSVATVGEPRLELRAASAPGAFADVNLRVYPGEIVGLAGVVGSGASDVAAAIAADIRLSAGELRLDGATVRGWRIRTAIRRGVLYVPPERSLDAIFPRLSVRENVSIGFLNKVTRAKVVSPRHERRLVNALTERTRVKTDSSGTPAGELSGGNQQKLVFARWMERAPAILVLNEPTRGIDVGSREDIYDLIRTVAAAGAGVVLCSESLEELIGLSNRIIVFRAGRPTAEVPAPVHHKPEEVDIIRHMV